MQADLSFNSTFPGWLFDYPHGKGNEICLTSSTDHANKQWPSAIERKKKRFFISGLSVIAFKDGQKSCYKLIPLKGHCWSAR